MLWEPDGTESLRATVKSAFIEAAALVLPTEMQIDVNVTECSNSKLGDYQVRRGLQCHMPNTFTCVTPALSFVHHSATARCKCSRS